MPGLSLVALPVAPGSAEPDLSPVHALLDFLAEGSSLSPRLREAEALQLVGELGTLAAALASRDTARAVVRLCADPEPWEIGLERSGSDVLISVFQGGAVPDVLVFEGRIPGELL